MFSSFDFLVVVYGEGDAEHSWSFLTPVSQMVPTGWILSDLDMLGLVQMSNLFLINHRLEMKSGSTHGKMCFLFSHASE